MVQKDVTILAGAYRLNAILGLPEKPKGVVLFAHGSGSGRLSTRNQFVAGVLQQHGLATLLMDLLTQEEEAVDNRTRQFRFDINLLSERLIAATEWLKTEPELQALPIGYFGASTGAACALVAAAHYGKAIGAVVSRGGRPDLADTALEEVRAATLFIVGGNDFGVIELNEQAYKRLQCKKKMEIIAGATHLFEEKGALELVAKLSANWFSEQL